ncbi:MAG TPA: hypothetical protein VGO07_06070 [Candidatus Saccharimonadales bacterium]|jgi:hypothetical protein|nr:hypothetical protein [Candidatus Saccharimonadales bacterium]
MFKHKRLWSALVAVAGLLVLCSTAVSAQNVTQGYSSDQALQNGMIVRLKAGDGTKVVSLKQQEASEMLGITVANNDAPVSLSDPTKKQVFIATFGKYDVLVSNQNGPIKSGDYITISAVEGVGMKAGTDQEIILGKAVGNFTGAGDADSRVQLTDSLGGKQDVSLKRVRVDISVAHNPNFSGDITAGVPRFLSKAAQLVTKKPVTALRIYAGMGVLALAVGVAGGIIYAGVRTGMTAVGRNPLAKGSITKNLVTVVLIAIIVVLIGVIAVYLLLKV